jgi:hypothetical protein
MRSHPKEGYVQFPSVYTLFTPIGERRSRAVTIELCSLFKKAALSSAGQQNSLPVIQPFSRRNGWTITADGRVNAHAPGRKGESGHTGVLDP